MLSVIIPITRLHLHLCIQTYSERRPHDSLHGRVHRQGRRWWQCKRCYHWSIINM